jgi:hypothetical protein
VTAAVRPSGGGQLLGRVRALLAQARDELDEPAERETVRAAARRLDEPLRVAIAGMVKAGKSTLLNAMVGEELAPTDAGECTRIVTWYRDGPAYRVMMHLSGGGLEPRPFDRVAGALRVSIGRPTDEVDHLMIEVPSRRLRQQTLIDTPGIASLSAKVSMRTHEFLEADEERPTQADAVIYLLRHMHGSDVRFLEAFHGDDLAAGSPINAIGVLSRADEIGGCQMDSMDAAQRVAARYHGDDRMRRLCPVIVPVAGLLAAAGATLREQEFRALATIAGGEMDDVVSLLLTADRFTSGATRIPVLPAVRHQLIGRLGVFGVRLSVQLIREGVATSADDLAKELFARSGLSRLNDVLTVQFVNRAQVLKARSALAVLDSLIRGGRNPGLSAAVEEIRASAHEFVEVRLLHLLRSGRMPGRPEQLAEMERLLGGLGASAAERLGLPPDTVTDVLKAEAQEALTRWLRVAEHPLSSREVRTAARATARSCEGIVASLGPAY